MAIFLSLSPGANNHDRMGQDGIDVAAIGGMRISYPRQARPAFQVPFTADRAPCNHPTAEPIINHGADTVPCSVNNLVYSRASASFSEGSQVYTCNTCVKLRLSPKSWGSKLMARLQEERNKQAINVA
ncbi:hypothetical protein [Blastomonas sp.]|uniref:hypothetical protein n=1 Tax=Blastomonas sp. TaxID=1909299 RepID=UPI003918DF13